MIKKVSSSFAKLLIMTSLLSTSLLPMTLENEAEASNKEDDWVPSRIDKCKDIEQEQQSKDDSSKESEKSKSDESVPSDGYGAFLKKGTKQNKAAQQVFDTFTKEYGTSGAFAVGVLVNINRESMFIQDIKEFEGGQNYSGRGGGLFQFTPAEKFTNSAEAKKGNDTWAVENQVAYVWNSEFKNRAVEPYFNGKAGGAAGVGLYGIPPVAKDIEELISLEDPEKATEGFYAGYLRGRDFHPDMKKSKSWIKEAESVFNKDNIKADPSKFQLGSKGKKVVDSSSSEKGKDSEDKEQEKLAQDCNVDVKKKKKDDGATAGKWGKDGTGSHKYTAGKMWKAKDLPKDLEQYAIDPKYLGLSFGSHNDKWIPGSNPAYNQCVNLSSAMFAQIWFKNGKPAASNLRTGNGVETADTLSSQLGGSVKAGKPSKGSVFQVGATTVDVITHGGPGHTGIVCHVFKDGSLLIVEQNMQGYSGEGNGESHTWNYRIVSKSGAAKMQYLTLEGVKGYELNPKLKKLGE